MAENTFPANGVTLELTNFEDTVLKVGNRILERKERETVNFKDLDSLAYALKLRDQQQVKIKGVIPDEVVQMLEEKDLVTPPPVQKSPTRVSVPVYEGGQLVAVREEENGAIVQLANLTYNPDGTVATVVEKDEYKTVTSTMHYDAEGNFTHASTETTKGGL